MNVLGLSFDFHDASAAIVQDGKVIASAAEERFTRQKHDFSFPQYAIDFCLRQANIKAEDIDEVVFYEKPATKVTRVMSSAMAPWPYAHKEFAASMQTWLGRKLWTRSLISRRMQLHPEYIKEFNHHESHAAQAFLGSGFSESAVLVIDAVGEWSTTSLVHATWVDGKPEFKTLHTSEYPHSLGLFYSAFTEFLGFRAMNDECSLMALAGFGQPRFTSELGQLISFDDRGNIRLSREYLDFDRSLHSPFTKKFTEVFGEIRKAPYNFTTLSKGAEITAEEQRYADLAASVQRVFEDALLTMARLLSKETGSKNLCYAGGGALNCVANTRLIRESGFENIFIPVEPGDGGAAIGAALLSYYKRTSGAASHIPHSPYIGEAHSEEAILAMIPHVNVPDLRRFRKKGLTSESEAGWTTESFANEDELLQAVAKELLADKIVGWMQGAFEIGPRALGHRSLLIRPDSIAVAERLSKRVKDRAPFRPYALSMTKAEAAKLLDADEHFLKQSPLRWMQVAASVRESMRPKVCAGLHTDGTTRPQVVDANQNPRFARLLETFGKTFGSEVLINTSFNESDYPIVNTPAEALLMFARTEMDILVVGNAIIRKVSKNG